MLFAQAVAENAGHLLNQDKVVCFVLAFLANMAKELANVYRHYSMGRRMPARFSKVGYWLVRVTLALIAGVLAAFVTEGNKTAAFVLGFTFPETITQAYRPTDLDPAPPQPAEPKPAEPKQSNPGT